MSLTLTAFNIGTQTFSVCSNRDDTTLAWQNLTYKYGVYTLNQNQQPLITYYDSNAVGSFNWNTDTQWTSSINVSGIILDTSIIYLCAYDPLNPSTSVIINLLPSYTNIQTVMVGDNALSATAYYQQVSTLALSAVAPTYQAIWNIVPPTNVVSAYYGGSYHSFLNPVVDTIANAGTIVVSSNQASYQTYNLTLSVFGHPFSYNQYASSISLADLNITLNDIIRVNQLDQQTDRIILSAYQYNTNLNPAYSVQWNISPNTGSELLSSITQVSAMPLNTTTSAVCADYVAFITTDYSQEYIYSLNTYTGTITGNFRPYANLGYTGILYPTVSAIDETQQNHQYALDVHIKDGSQLFNMNNYEYLVWKNTSSNSNVYLRKVKDGLTYTLNTIDYVDNINRLYLNIIPNTTTVYPKLCTFNFMVCALDGGSIADSVSSATFTITANEWVDSSIFNPKFNIQYESPSLVTTYRPLTAATYLLDYTTSQLPIGKGNLIFTFDDCVSTIPYDVGNSIIPTVYHNFDGTVAAGNPVLCTVNLMITVSAAGYADYISRNAPTRYVQFVDFPVASNFVVYPEFTWDGSNWNQVVYSQDSNSGTVLSATIQLSAYGFSHTDNFFVSSQINNGTFYRWAIQNLDGTNETSTLFTINTGWITKQAPVGTASYSICAAVYNSNLPTTMPAFYYDTPVGQKYPNFSSTFDAPTSTNRKHIDYYGVDTVGLTPIINQIDTNSAGIPNRVYLSGSYVYPIGTNTTPFDFEIGLFNYTISTNYATTNVNAVLQNGASATNNIYLNVDDIGNTYLSLPKYEVNVVDIYPTIGLNQQIRVLHPSSNDWVFTNSGQISTIASMVQVEVYSMLPLIYTPNRYVLSGTDVRFENLVEGFSGVQNFIWLDREVEATITTCTPYVTNYDTNGSQDITLTVYFSGANNQIVEYSNIFPNIVNVQSEYELFDADINRVFDVTVLELPYDVNNAFIGTNDWVTYDTFNTCMQKLYDNLGYLKNMAQLYDTPPTEYFGWLGSLAYSNSSPHFRWFVNSLNINYGYNEPNLAVDDQLTNLTDVYVRNNIMYITNQTSIMVLSSEFQPTIIGTRDYKAIGDPFTNIKAIQLDDADRIYILDENRIVVFEFNINIGVWNLRYAWGGLGGASANNRLNNPKDFYVDKNNNIWVADTDNNVIKKYTRTGSWLQTISSPMFNNPPLSVVLDENGNIQVLTTAEVITFDSTGTYVQTDSLDYEGALKLRECKDNGFGYICYADKIIKHMYSPALCQVPFANDIANYVYDYRNVYHDEFRNLYIVGSNHILKYVDKLTKLSLIQNTENMGWTLEDLYVDKDEFMQDWPINRSLNRMFDNIEIFRKSILGKFDYEVITTSTSSIVLSTIPIPDGFDHCSQDWLYYNGIYVTQISTHSYEKPCIRSFTVDEYLELPYTKDDTFIGLNEFVSSPVFNRPISKLLACQEVLKELLS